MLEMIDVADYYLLPGLVKLCEAYLCKNLYRYPGIKLFSLARKFGLKKLEGKCTERMASWIHVVR